MITAQIESLTQGLAELKPLLPIHYKELSEHLKHNIPLDPQYEAYLAKDAKGEILYVTLREKGNLIGYFVGFIQPGLHYKTCLTLQLDIVYVVPEHRGKHGGAVLMKCIAKEFQRRRARLWLMGMKEEHRPWMEALLTACGFEPFERTYALWAGDS